MHKARPAGAGERIKARQALHTSCVNASQYLPFYKANINTINHISSPSRAAHTKRVWQINRRQTMLSLFQQRIVFNPKSRDKMRDCRRRAWEKDSRDLVFVYRVVLLFVPAPAYLRRQQMIRLAVQRRSVLAQQSLHFLTQSSH